MTTGGWATLLMAVGGVTLWHVWCMYKVLSSKDVSHLAAESTIEFPDEEESRKQ